MASLSFSAVLFISLSIIMCVPVHSAWRMDHDQPIPSVDCQSIPQSSYPFCNPNLSPEERTSDLVSRLQLDELIAQTSSVAPAIPRLGIKDYNWRSNCDHGWTASGGHWLDGLYWTVFPAPIGLAATFNSDLLSQIGQVTSTEGRAIHNVMMANFNGSSTEAAGLNCFSPNVNLFRDPRWGRGQETLGEDPYVISVLGVAYTRGLQEGEDEKYLKIASCPKHFAVHSGPDETRVYFTANTSLHDLYDTYLPAFKSQVMGAKAAQIMPALSGTRTTESPDGAPDAANNFMLKTVLREEFNAPNISTVSDNGAIAEVCTTHHYVSTEVDAAAVCMNATTDLDLGPDKVYPDYLLEAIQKGKCSVDSVKSAVWRNFLVRFKVGDFDPVDLVPYQKLDASALNTPSNKQLNLEAAQQSIVLLKNEEDTLPIDRTRLKRLALIGPNANSTKALLSCHPGVPDKVVTVQEGIENALLSYNVQMLVSYGCTSVSCDNETGFPDAIAAAEAADQVIMVMGSDPTRECEAIDRKPSVCGDEEKDAIGLPGCQADLIQAVMKVTSNVIIVLLNGGPISFHDLLNSDGISAVVEAFFPGPQGGTAVASVLFGDYNPAGRMPVSTYKSSSDIPSFVDYDMTTPPGRTYRYYTGDALSVPFGFGLSYTSFNYSDLRLSATNVEPCKSLIVSVKVANVGKRGGEEVIQVYLIPETAPKPFFPRLQLVGFKRTPLLDSMASDVFLFTVHPYLMSFVDDSGESYIFPGKYLLSVSLPKSLDNSVEFVITGDSPVRVSSCAGVPQCMAC